MSFLKNPLGLCAQSESTAHQGHKALLPAAAQPYLVRNFGVEHVSLLASPTWPRCDSLVGINFWMTEETENYRMLLLAIGLSLKVQMEMWWEGRIRKVVQVKAECRLAAGEGRTPWLCSVPDFLPYCADAPREAIHVFATVHHGGGEGVDRDGGWDMAEVALCWWGHARAASSHFSGSGSRHRTERLDCDPQGLPCLETHF